MEAVVHHILDLSKKEKDLAQLKKSLESRIEALQKHVGQVNAALNALDVKQHTLGYIYILFLKTTTPSVDNAFIQQTEGLIAGFDPKQARMAGNKFGSIIHRYTEILRDNHQAGRGILQLQSLIERFRPDAESLTPFHCDYIQLCLKSRNYKTAVALLEDKIFDVSPKKTGVVPREFLLYYYYGGMIYIGLKELKKALYFFETALTIPANALSAIMVESYKKYILVSLLLNGKPAAIPKNAASTVQRHIKVYCQEYVEFGNAYATRNMEKVMQVASQHKELFQKDRNLGLVKQCVKSLYRLNIQRLTQTYLTLSLQDIATTAHLQNAREAEYNVLRMIESGEIFATINQKDGMVSFHEDAQQFGSVATANLLDERIDRNISLSHKLKAVDEEIASSTEYLAKLNGADRFLHEEMFNELSDRPTRQGKIGRMFDFLRG
eukprot:GEZU01039722.1.p1 GENE.GEZU01039722.1~~GEZU01039722.1.p1  ORF type:complete len:437 (-),score=163.11 GEZU01039722.1:603-1913(-)